MIKTLHGYLGRDLARIGGLALISFTMLMTVFAVIEPLRRQGGINISRVAELLLYAFPMMLSFTLPVAALFASSIVYGRFSQERELMACRASGISTPSLLVPAFVLGAVVTVASLLLNSFVTPRMLSKVEATVRENFRELAYRHLRTRPYADYSNKIFVHADYVDEKNDVIYGLVVADSGNPQKPLIVLAQRALVNFTEKDDLTYITFYMNDFHIARANDNNIFKGTAHPPISQPLPSPSKEDPSWYNWGKLMRTLKNPLENSAIRRDFKKTIIRDLANDMFATGIAESVNTGQGYEKLNHAGMFYRIRAGTSRVTDKGEVRLGSAERDGHWIPVEVTVFEGNKPLKVITAGQGKVVTDLSPLSHEWFVTIELMDDVSILSLTESRATPQKRNEWKIGELPIPKEIEEHANQLKLAEVIQNPDQLTSDPTIIKRIVRFRERVIGRLMDKVRAEMNMRAAYGISCFLMVVLGASLGMIFKGGQVIVAFAITAIPATLVIITMLLGKQMVNNQDVPPSVGFMVIWLGVVALLVADVVVYAFLRRQ